MGRLLAPLAALTALLSIAQAGIEFKSPEAGSTAKAKEALHIEWIDGGDGPPLADLLSYELHLCVGGDVPTAVFPITTQGKFSAGNQAEAVIGDGVAADDPENAYVIRMVATAAKGGTLTVYSSRFSYSGMKAQMPAGVEVDMKNVKGTDPPPTVDTTVKDPADASQPDQEMFEMQYTMQTGPTRYAPMQPVPGTKITAKNAKPQYPTSAFTIAVSHLPIPKIQTTITQSQKHKVTSLVNTNAAAPHPTDEAKDDMAKFLRRWAD